MWLLTIIISIQVLKMLCDTVTLAEVNAFHFIFYLLLFIIILLYPVFDFWMKVGQNRPFTTTNAF